MERQGTGGRLYCIAEDRVREMPGVCLLIQSLLRLNPEARVRLVAPSLDPATAIWLAGFRQVEVVTRQVGGASSWNVKPLVLLAALRDGHDEAVWLDADMIVAGNLSSVLDGLDPATLLIAEEALGGTGRRDRGRRAEAWGLPVGRRVEVVLNTCIVRVTRHHVALLETWRDLMSDPAYLAAQDRPIAERPVQSVGDQDVMTAVLSSRAFAEVPLRVLRQGRDIIQFYGLHGFTSLDRLRVALGTRPLFVHSQGRKPWRLAAADAGERKSVERLHALYRDTSPYVALAKRYRNAVPGDRGWMAPTTRVGRVLVGLGMGSVALTGLPLAVLFDGLWIVKKLRGSA